MRSAYLLGGLSFFVVALGIGSIIALPRASADQPYLVQCGGDFVYYLRDPAFGADGALVAATRYLIPRDEIRASWQLGGAPINYVEHSKMITLPIRGTLTYAPGTLLKVPDDPSVYVVTRNRVLRPIISESAAAKHFGLDWASKIKNIPSSWLPQYQFGGLIFNETWFSDKEFEVSAATLYEATDPAWDSAERSAALRDQERLSVIQGTIIPFLYDVIRGKGLVAPQVYSKWLLGTKGADWVYGTDTVNNNFRKVLARDCATLTDGRCIPPAPDAQINTNICGTQAPYGYELKGTGAFEVSFCVESNSALWQPRSDDFDAYDASQLLRSGWYKYSMNGLERISP